MIAYGDTGHAYDTIFGPYLLGAKSVVVEDPYIRMPYQIANFVRFCETVVKAATIRSVTLITSCDQQTDQVGLREKLDELKQSLLEYDVALDVRLNHKGHNREVRLDNGWIIKISRGLDLYQEPEGSYAVGATDLGLRQCLETKVDVFCAQSAEGLVTSVPLIVPSDPLKLLQVNNIVGSGESTNREFKSTLRTNLHTGQADARIEMSVLKTIAAFLNSEGGALVIGVADDSSAIGVGADKFKSEDAMYLHLVNLIRDRIGPHQMMFVHPHFDDFEGKRILIVECQPSQSPVYVKDGNAERFYIRTGPSTTDLTASLMATYIKQRFS